MAMKNVALWGFTISITWVMLLATVFFFKSITILWEGWFVDNALTIAIVSGVIIGIGILTNMISVKQLMKRG